MQPFNNMKAGRIITFYTMLKDNPGVLSSVLSIFAARPCYNQFSTTIFYKISPRFWGEEVQFIDMSQLSVTLQRTAAVLSRKPFQTAGNAATASGRRSDHCPSSSARGTRVLLWLAGSFLFLRWLMVPLLPFLLALGLSAMVEPRYRHAE